VSSVLSMLCPSRGRPRQLAALAQSIADTASPRGVELLVYLDADDPDLGMYQQKLAPFKFAHSTVGERVTVGKAWNILAGKARGNLLMLGSDDLLCQSVGWDRVLQKEAGRFADGIFALWPDNGAGGESLRGRPVVSRRWYKTLGYFTPEHFEFGGAAAWLAEIAGKLDRIHRAVGAIIEHRQPSGGGSARATALARIERENQARRDATRYAQLAGERAAAVDKLRAILRAAPPAVVQPPAVIRTVAPHRKPDAAIPAVQRNAPPQAKQQDAAIPKLLHFFWIGSELPDFAKYIMEQWHVLNPEYTIYLHGEEVLRPEYQPIYDQMQTYATQVDVLKWCALQSWGGWALDADTVPLRPMSTFTGTLDKAARFVAVDVPPGDEVAGVERCDMGFIGASMDSRIWAAVNWYMAGNVDMARFSSRSTKGGACCMEWLLENVSHLMTRFPAALYCPYSTRNRPWLAKGRAFWRAYRAGDSTVKHLAEYNRTFGNPLAWHIWGGAIK